MRIWKQIKIWDMRIENRKSKSWGVGVLCVGVGVCCSKITKMQNGHEEAIKIQCPRNLDHKYFLHDKIKIYWNFFFGNFGFTILRFCFQNVRDFRFWDFVFKMFELLKIFFKKIKKIRTSNFSFFLLLKFSDFRFVDILQICFQNFEIFSDFFIFQKCQIFD